MHDAFYPSFLYAIHFSRAHVLIVNSSWCGMKYGGSRRRPTYILDIDKFFSPPFVSSRTWLDISKAEIFLSAFNYSPRYRNPRPRVIRFNIGINFRFLTFAAYVASYPTFNVVNGFSRHIFNERNRLLSVIEFSCEWSHSPPRCRRHYYWIVSISLSW